MPQTRTIIFTHAPELEKPVPPPAPDPNRKEPLRGVWDVIAAMTKAVGIQPCGGCKQRQEALNKVFPFTPSS